MTSGRSKHLTTELASDCTRCAALCCVAPAFSAGADFAIDKDPHRACPNLASDFRCRIHDRLRERGFPGCVVFECYGAGQKVTQETFAGRNWRSSPEIGEQMFEVFRVMRPLHEQLMFLDQALRLEQATSLHDEIRSKFAEIESLTLQSAEDLLEADLGTVLRDVNSLLLRVGDLVRAS